MKWNKQPFCAEFMTKKRPTPPKCVCKNNLNRWLGIVSPSLHMLVSIGDKGNEKAKELEKYEELLMRYMCYRRILSKAQWKVLYRAYRKNNRKQS